MDPAPEAGRVTDGAVDRRHAEPHGGFGTPASLSGNRAQPTRVLGPSHVRLRHRSPPRDPEFAKAQGRGCRLREPKLVGPLSGEQPLPREVGGPAL